MKIIFALLLVFSSVSVFCDSKNIRPSYSGTWYNIDQSGHGISVEVLNDERTLFFWYTYDLDGNPVWLTALGENSEVSRQEYGFIPLIRVEATAYYNEGMIWGEFDPLKKTQQEWGMIVLDFPYSECDRAHMEWFPTMEGFTQGAADLVRLTSLLELDCAEPQGLEGIWEVQFGYDAEVRSPVEVVATPNPETGMTDDLFEFFDIDGCLWSGEIASGWGLIYAEWGNQCGANPVNHSGGGTMYFEHMLCNSESECARKDEVMIFEDEDEGDFLIFSR
jgi:hypothetical protein